MTATTVPALSFQWRTELEPAFRECNISGTPVLLDFFSPT